MAHVLVTGGPGPTAGHVIVRLLAQGHRVRSTLRSLREEAGVRAVLREAGLTGDDALTFVEDDLVQDSGWAAAVTGVDHVLHLASPVHTGRVEDEVIVPARDGALRVLRAARDAGVQRVVSTSAFHAVGSGHGHVDRVFTEQDWSPLHGPGVDAYGRSEILAERAAWDFIEDDDSGMELRARAGATVPGRHRRTGDGRGGDRRGLEARARGPGVEGPDPFHPERRGPAGSPLPR
ncbi:hypothetical protein GCM10027586_09430 [Kineococcus gypseus]|uniref:NAD-dependent epimerase/dehydratase family protein n=1 Tax=Kineococcus gypseus TaxID=1637102 RepID=UPI003D7E923E